MAAAKYVAVPNQKTNAVLLVDRRIGIEKHVRCVRVLKCGH